MKERFWSTGKVVGIIGCIIGVCLLLFSHALAMDWADAAVRANGGMMDTNQYEAAIYNHAASLRLLGMLFAAPSLYILVRNYLAYEEAEKVRENMKNVQK